MAANSIDFYSNLVYFSKSEFSNFFLVKFRKNNKFFELEFQADKNTKSTFRQSLSFRIHAVFPGRHGINKWATISIHTAWSTIKYFFSLNF